jgi:7-cyano-7-deazaguanine synthase
MNSFPEPTESFVASVTARFRFEAAHRMPGFPPDHPNSRLHGHSYEVDVTVRGLVDPRQGFVMDHGDLVEIAGPVVRELDHQYLNEIPALECPTSEVIARWLWRRLAPALPGLAEIALVRGAAGIRVAYTGPIAGAASTRSRAENGASVPALASAPAPAKRDATALVILSGGQDSVTCLHWALREFARVEALSFDYGQRHAIELNAAREIASSLGVAHKLVKAEVLGQLAPSALTDASRPIDAQGGLHGLPSTFVPGRNAVFLNLAAAHAVPRGIQDLVIGACETDFSGYPDCREEFIAAMERALALALGVELRIHRPLMFRSKAQIFALAEELGCLSTVVEKTHTCYQGVRETLHAWGYGCGECPACVLRRQGFEEFTRNEGGRADGRR